MTESEWEEYTSAMRRVPWEDAGRIDNPFQLTAEDGARLLSAVQYAICANADFLEDAERMGYGQEQLWKLIPYLGKREHILRQLAAELREHQQILFLSTGRLELLYFAYAAADQLSAGRLHQWEHLCPERDFEKQKDKLTTYYLKEREHLCELHAQILKMEEYCHDEANARR